MRRIRTAVALALALGTLCLTAKTSWNNPPKRATPPIEHGTFRSASLSTDVGYNICLPTEYHRNAGRRFPVIYYLHGYEGNESSYLKYGDYWREATKRFGPIILVFVNGGETSFFSDSPDGSIPGESVVIKELIPHIDGKFRTLADRGGRSVHGYSMGGFGALKLAFKYPDLFSSVVAFGSTLADATEFKKRLGKVYTPMFGGDARRFAENDPLVLAERNAEKIRGQVAIRLVIGTKDDFLERHRVLNGKLEALKIPHEFRQIPGAGHKKDDLYETAALDAFQFSSEHFAKPDPR